MVFSYKKDFESCLLIIIIRTGYMANLYRPKTIALAKMAALPRYKHPADLAGEFRKPTSVQLG